MNQGLAGPAAERQMCRMFSDNAARQRYELEHENGPSFADYRDQRDVRAILHVETPVAARGRGHAAQLMEAIVADARERGLKVLPLCSYAAAYFRRHAASQDVRAG